MKKPSSTYLAVTAEEKAQTAHKAIQSIQKWVKNRYPSITSATQSRLILECLIEINAENRFIAAQ
jgi:hypothetical protein